MTASSIEVKTMVIIVDEASKVKIINRRQYDRKNFETIDGCASDKTFSLAISISF